MSEEDKGGDPSKESKEPTKKATTDDLPPEALTERLARERTAGAKDAEKALATKLGISVEDAAAQLAEYAKLKDASKSEQQRLQDERDALKPRATRADQLERRIAELSETEYGLLDDETKALVDDLSKADGGEVDHDARIKVIASLKRRGVIAGKAKTPELPKGADTSKSDKTPKVEKEPEKDSPEFHHSRWKAMPEGILKAAYWNDHHGLITKAEAFKSAN
jgi:hypothetical protein